VNHTYTTIWGILQVLGEDCGGVSDCEELVWVTHKRRKKKVGGDDE